MNKLPDASAFFGHVASIATEDRDQLRHRANNLFNRFKDYKVATVTLGDMSIQDVAPIFERINSSGTPLTIVDLMRAATWSPEFDLIDSIDALLEELRSKGFAGIDRKVVLRNLSAAAGGGFSVESIDLLRHHTADVLKSAVAATEEAYRRAVDFLVTQIRVESAEILPYKNQLTVLAEIFRCLPSPSSEQYEKIEHWFWHWLGWEALVRRCSPPCYAATRWYSAPFQMELLGSPSGVSAMAISSRGCGKWRRRWAMTLAATTIR
jgi:hypothetical protein